MHGKRRRFFAFIKRQAGIAEGQVLPWWCIALALMLFPSNIKWWIGANTYDIRTDTINIGGVRLSLYFLEDLFCRPSPPGYWFRVVAVNNGIPVMECRTDGYE